ncbi:hypothetical protein ACFQ4K_02130 [Tistrella bauzanensis]
MTGWVGRAEPAGPDVACGRDPGDSVTDGTKACPIRSSLELKFFARAVDIYMMIIIFMIYDDACHEYEPHQGRAMP